MNNLKITLLLLSLLAVFSMYPAGDFHDKNRMTGAALITLGILGNIVAYINTLPATDSSISALCAYPIPDMPYMQSLVAYLRNTCSEAWQKYLFFTVFGIVPGIYLVSKSYCHEVYPHEK